MADRMAAGGKARPKAAAKSPMTRKPLKPGADGVVRLAGGNPQIAKGDGDAPVQAFIAAMPGWQKAVGRKLDALIVKTVPAVAKAVKWNSPFYGVAAGNWFLSFHCTAKYVKVAFFRGAALTPLPPVESRQKEVRYFHIHEGDALDEAQVVDWVKQAAALPGQRM